MDFQQVFGVGSCFFVLISHSLFVRVIVLISCAFLSRLFLVWFILRHHTFVFVFLYFPCFFFYFIFSLFVLSWVFIVLSFNGCRPGVSDLVSHQLHFSKLNKLICPKSSDDIHKKFSSWWSNLVSKKEKYCSLRLDCFIVNRLSIRFSNSGVWTKVKQWFVSTGANSEQ